MCGFVGIINKKVNNKKNISILKKMTKTLKYRGPDQRQYFIGTSTFIYN